jgi:hypothetical protein
VVRDVVLNDGWFCAAIESDREAGTNSESVAE